MSFPLNPNPGDTYTKDDTLWTFNGRRWDRTRIGANNSTNYSNYPTTAALLARIAHLEQTIAQEFLILE